MILDGRLPSGGWNYGNTTIFDGELKPCLNLSWSGSLCIIGVCAAG